VNAQGDWTAHLALLIDTHALVWIGQGNARLPVRVIEHICDPDTDLFVSAVTAYEYADLHHRGRLPDAAEFFALQERMLFRVLDFSADIWSLAVTLPPIHRDPVDRMLIAHALSADLTLVTADATIHQYPLKTFW
jgi:PIN domain nuclease of toxin-antitoxin system